MSSEVNPPPGQHNANTLSNFQPLAPTLSPSRRLQHISTPNGSSASFAHVVAKQWRADVASNRITWAVVGTDVEAIFLYRDLVINAMADIPESSINRQSVILLERAEDCATLRQPGQLVVMPYSHLRELLFLGLFVGIPLVSWVGTLGGPTIVMDFNWGKVTFDMAFSCSLIAKYVNASSNERTNVFMACTVSDNTTTYFGEVNQHIKVQQVMTPFDAHDVKLRFHQENKPLLATILGTVDEPRKREGRFILAMDGDESPENIMPQSLSSLDFTSTGELEFLLLDPGMSYVGCIGNLRGVIIRPYTSVGWTMCDGQPARCYPYRIARSQAEIHFYTRYMHEFVEPEAVIMQNEEQFNTLPAVCDSPAHTVDLAALLICCKLLWPRTAIAKVPVYLPRDKQGLLNQVQILGMKGILATSSGKSTPLDQPELSMLDTKTVLTTTGKIAATLSASTMNRPHSAHLLAQLLDPDGPDAALSPTSEAVVSAIVSLAAVTESVSGATIINEAITLQKDEKGDDEWYNTELYGVGAGEAWRGPIWLALAIWQRLRTDHTWRAPFDNYDEVVHDLRLFLNNGELLVNLSLSYYWDTVYLTAVEAAHARGLDWSNLSDTARLTDEEMLAVEKALVRAYLEKIAYVTDTGDGFAEATHLLTGREMRRPFDSQARQIWWSECQMRTALMSRDGSSTYVFFIYTHMRYGKDEAFGDVAPIPLDNTYVSAMAVESVLAEAGKLELMPGHHRGGTSRGSQRGT